MLQRLSEDLEYYELLDKAAKCQSSLEQMCYVAAFTVSSYSTTVHRTGKPFNPLLGETFELDRLRECGYRSLCEQVCWKKHLNCETKLTSVFSQSFRLNYLFSSIHRVTYRFDLIPALKNKHTLHELIQLCFSWFASNHHMTITILSWLPLLTCSLSPTHAPFLRWVTTLLLQLTMPSLKKVGPSDKKLHWPASSEENTSLSCPWVGGSVCVFISRSTLCLMESLIYKLEPQYVDIWEM